ncbi:YciI family protein [Nonomuraea sp. NPDC059023]|uniref:YciI family protein n=1 Tax=unclassified Nonomuraea TaxID=2593643 RepID=UPI0036946D1E
MQYALVIYAEPGLEETVSEAEREAMYAEYFALGDDPRVVGGAQLQAVETATTVRVSEGKTLMTDGPFADTKEVLGGFCLVEAANLDEAVEMAARIPAARLGGVVEVRPVVRR